MNVLMLNYEFPPIGGGAANAHLRIVKEYAEVPDLKIDILTSAAKPGFFTEQLADNVTVYKVGLHKKILHFWRKIEVIEWLLKSKKHYRKLLREKSYDLVHAFFGFPSGYLCYKTTDKVPYIISLRGSDVPGENVRLQREYKLLAPLFKSIWKNAAALAACSEGLRKRALNFLPSADISVICNGVDAEKFKPNQAKSKDDTFRLITVGRLSPTKRVDMLIDTVGILKAGGINVKLKVIGGGALKNQLKQTVLDKCLGDCVEIIGRVETQQMPQLYRQADIYVSATMQEGMSNAMLEAMACGLPIVTTKCEGLAELVADNGTIVNMASAEAIAEAVKKLLDDKSMYISMSQSARHRAEQFTWKKVADSYLRLYEKVLGRKI
ncbi:MAG: glycosyltransferase family 4 protein [Sedimentisphaerales bacterium]|nr:glycosyltransferase family 4 protein [Sedimentisphaerales bacterium]